MWGKGKAGHFLKSWATLVSKGELFHRICYFAELAKLRIIFKHNVLHTCYILFVVCMIARSVTQAIHTIKFGWQQIIKFQDWGSGRGLPKCARPVFTRRKWGKRWKTSVKMVDAPVKIWTGHLPSIHTSSKCYSFLSTTSFCTNLISNQRATQTSHLTTAGDNFVLQWAPDRPTQRLPAGSHYWSMTVTKQETRSCISFPFSSAEGRPALYPSAWRQQRRYQYFSHADFRTSKLITAPPQGQITFMF